MADLEVTATGTAGSPSAYSATASKQPTEVVTDLLVTGNFTEGILALEVQNPVDSSWTKVWDSNQLRRCAILTPNINLEYRWVSQGIVGTVNGHFGASG
jgi:hypothetical protein